MEKKYSQITIEERCEIARLQSAGQSIRQIAASLDRSPSTVAREVKRNTGQTGVYKPAYADQISRSRRWKGSKLDRDSVLRNEVLSRLELGWSPEQVAGRLAMDMGKRAISYETIYRFIYAQLARTKDYTWRNYLPQGRSKRGRRSRKAHSPAMFIANRRRIDERPEAVQDRQLPGHWEADLILFKKYGQAVLTLHDRFSRLLIAVRPPSKAAEPIAKAMTKILATLPPALRQTVTFDNGTEFARHYELHSLGVETFFCDTYSPWQKGGIENAIGRMRRNLPRKTDLATLSEEQFVEIIQAYNNTPRKCLDYQTPAELFSEELLHFKCERTFPPSRE